MWYHSKLSSTTFWMDGVKYEVDAEGRVSPDLQGNRDDLERHPHFYYVEVEKPAVEKEPEVKAPEPKKAPAKKPAAKKKAAVKAKPKAKK